MRRGDVYTLADRSGDYTSKPRPVVIVQSDRFETLESVTICPITSFDAEAPLMRVQIEPSDTLALGRRSWIEVDKITTVRRSRLGSLIGRLADYEVIAMNSVLILFLGIG